MALKLGGYLHALLSEPAWDKLASQAWQPGSILEIGVEVVGSQSLHCSNLGREARREGRGGERAELRPQNEENSVLRFDAVVPLSWCM